MTIVFAHNTQESFFQIEGKKCTNIEMVQNEKNQTILFGWRKVYKYKKTEYLDMSEFPKINKSSGWKGEGIHLFYINEQGFIVNYESTSYCRLIGMEPRTTNDCLIINDISKV